MKTPEEIKKGLECCTTVGATCRECPYDETYCVDGEDNQPAADALAYIKQLESSLAQVEREMDALASDFKLYRDRNIKQEYGVYACDLCKYGGDPYSDEMAGKRCPKGCEGYQKWKWRGVCPENTKED